MTKSIEYLAGIFDAEGCVHMPMRTPSIEIVGSGISLITTVEMVDPKPVEQFGSKFPAKIRLSKRVGRRVTYVWSISGTKSKEFMEHVYPHAIVKRPHLALGLKFCATINRSELFETRVALREELHAIQIRGRNTKSALTVRDLPSAIDDEYLFGFFDGEGCITAPIGSDGTPRLKVVVANAVEAGATIFMRRWGGSIHRREPNNPRCLPLYYWYLQGEACKQFLLDADKHLLVKQAQVTKGLELLSLNYNWLNSCRHKVALDLKELNSGQFLTSLND